LSNVRPDACLETSAEVENGTGNGAAGRCADIETGFNTDSKERGEDNP
jgi:hypothetical protein